MTALPSGLLVNGRFLTRAPTGVDRFALQLMAAVARRQTRRVRVAVPRGTRLLDPAFGDAHLVGATGTRQGQGWEQFDLPSAADSDALINLCNTAPIARARQMVVIHDLGTVANAANYGLVFRNWYRLMHATIMRRARVVATVSKFSADELTRHYGKRARGLEVIPESGEHILDQPADDAVIDRLGLRDRRYVLAVGSLSHNKNFKAVIAAVRLIADPDLLVVAVGGGDSRVFAGASLADPGLRPTGRVSDGELRALYEHAACFAFPSYYEGFGLPPLEAMACGCPVIVSDRASLPEVCGDAALYCKAEDPATLASAIKGLLSSPGQQQELRASGRARSKSFSWNQAATHFEEIVHAHFS